MYYNLIIAVLLGILLSCTSTETQKNEKNEDKPIPKESIEYAQAQIIEYRDSVKQSYTELIDFKKEKNFKLYGFSKEGGYNEWLITLQSLIKNPMSKVLFEDQIVVGDIQTLGMVYSNSLGNETQMTIRLRKFLDKAFYPDAIVEEAKAYEIETDNEDNRQLIGEWKITNSTVNISYKYQIYRKENQILGIKDDNLRKPELLIKKGNKYTIQDSKWGEYYMIDDNKNLRLFDQDGDLGSAGYSAKLIRKR